MVILGYTAEEFIADLDAPYAWPGGYPRYFLCDDGGVLSFRAAKANRATIADAIRDGDRGGWRVIACVVNWEDADLVCGQSGDPIPSAYGEDAN